MLDQASILLFIISFVDIALGLFVLLKDPKGKTNRSFFLLSLAALIWINASYFEDELADPARMFFLLRLDFASGILAAFALLIFCLDVSETAIAGRIRKLLVGIPLAFSFLVFMTGSILSGYVIRNATIVPVLGGAHLIYDATVGFALLTGIGVLAWNYRKSSPEGKARLVYLFIGLALSSIIAFLTNIAIDDYIRRLPDYRLYSRLGLFSTIFFVLSSGYAIVKHRLFNLKVIATETLSLGILVFSLFQVLRSPSLLYLAINAIVFAVILAFIVMLIRSVEEGIKREERLLVLSDKLKAANVKLKELDEARAEFMSFASHQLQTPLTAIRGYASLLLEGSDGELTPNQKDKVGKISSNSVRMVELVEDYLNLSRIESGRMEFTLNTCSLEDICREVVSTLELKAKQKGLTLTFNKPSAPIDKVKVDGPKIREVISNLVDNAIKYTPGGGVTLDMAQRLRTTNEATDWLRVTVSDTGLGISKEELPHLFAKFNRGTDKERLKIKGTGLGLYVGKVMVEKHGGRVWAESDGEGKGSRFIVELPIA
jgi:signal transduction histidine kinase